MFFAKKFSFGEDELHRFVPMCVVGYNLHFAFAYEVYVVFPEMIRIENFTFGNLDGNFVYVAF